MRVITPIFPKNSSKAAVSLDVQTEPSESGSWAGSYDKVLKKFKKHPSKDCERYVEGHVLVVLRYAWGMFDPVAA